MQAQSHKFTISLLKFFLYRAIDQVFCVLIKNDIHIIYYIQCNSELHLILISVLVDYKTFYYGDVDSMVVYWVWVAKKSAHDFLIIERQRSSRRERDWSATLEHSQRTWNSYRVLILQYNIIPIHFVFLRFLLNFLPILSYLFLRWWW